MSATKPKNLRYKHTKTRSHVHFPIISQTNYSSFHNNTAVSEKQKRKTSQKTFIERNNYEQTQEKLDQSTFPHYFGSSELNSLLYTLKNYYEEVKQETEKNDNKLQELKKENESLKTNINELKENKEITLNPKEKISIINPTEDREVIMDKLYDLQEHKNQIHTEATNEYEYATTIKHMTENVKMEIQKVDAELLEIEQKIKDLQLAKKVIKENKKIRQKEKQHVNNLLNIIQLEKDKINEIILEQEIKKDKITKNTLHKENKVENLKQDYKEQEKETKEYLEQMKEKIIQNIKDYQYKKEKKEQKENDYISFVFGLNFFQKNFIDPYLKNEEIDTKKVKMNPEYKLLFSSNQFKVINQKDNDKLETEGQNGHNKSREKNHKHKDSPTKEHIHKEKRNSGSPNKHVTLKNTINKSTENISKKKHKNHKRLITLEELKTKFDEINLTYKQVYELYIKMTSNEYFARKTMNDLNKKQINLENLKDTYTQKVKQIINQDYKNFIDIVKKNDRFRNFLQKNEPELLKAKEQRENKISKKIKKLLNENYNSHPDYKSLEKQSKKLINRTAVSKTKIKYYLESILNSLSNANNLFDFDDIIQTETDEKMSSDNDIDKTESISKKFQRSATEPLKLYETKTTKNYIEDILNYAKKYDIKNSQYLYELLFTHPKSDFYYKQFLKKDILFDKFIFYYYYDLNLRKETIEVINKILSYYGSNDEEYIKEKNERVKLKNAKSGKIKHLILPDEIGVPFKTGLQKKKGNEQLLTTKSQKSSNQLLLIKNILSGNEQEKVKQPEKRKLTLQEEINNEYNYMTSDSDDEKNQKKKVKRPQTGTTITTNSSVTKRLYEPTLKKTQYLRNIKSGIQHIKRNTSENKEYEHGYSKTWKEIDELGKYFYIYNDPKINVNRLSNDTYKFIAQQMITIANRNTRTSNSKPKRSYTNQ